MQGCCAFVLVVLFGLIGFPLLLISLGPAGWFVLALICLWIRNNHKRCREQAREDGDRDLSASDATDVEEDG